ncbi:MAG: PKD domain-containing protein [Flavobacteriales bacterium]|nr:PKD domain-containing protein [Flavobacteriales bacterium]
MVAFGQGPYSVLLHGTIAGCTANSVATINSTTGSLPTITDMESSVGSNCTFDVSFFMDTQSGGFVVSTLCSGLIVADSVFYTASEFDSTQVFIVLNCGGSNADCEGVVGGPALPGTPCDDGDPNTVYDQWTPSCECVGGPLQPCNACFYYDSVSIGNGSVPFTIASTNCSSGGVTPYTYLYDFGDGETSIGEDVVHTYATGGNYNICMTLSDANGCTNTTCDSVVIGANGSINPVFFYDCEGLLNGPNTYGTPCSVPGTNEPGVWNYACSCIPDSIYYTCQAGFYAVQAYAEWRYWVRPSPRVWV